MELVLLLSLLFTVVNGVDFDPDSNNWIQGKYGSFSCSSSISVIVTKNGSEEASCTTDGTNICPKPAPSYAEVTVTGNTLNFTILNVSKSRDTATWECNTDSTFIDVKIAVPSVTIINETSLSFTDGETTSIRCKTGVSYPYATFTWSIGGTIITGATTTNNPDGTATSILQYTPDKTDHNKILQCSATNGYGSPQTDSVTLNIRFAVPSVTIINKNSLLFTDGQTTSITCKTGVSYPYATITWSIGVTTTTTNNPDGTTTSILQYTPDKTHHNKILQCSATNGVGSAQTDNITLLIRFPVPSVTIIKKDNLELTDGQTTSINCTTGVSYPHATITWSIGGSNINSGVTTTNNTDGTTTSILQYTPHKADRNKILQCSVTNGVGSAQSDSLTVLIRSVPEINNTNINRCLPATITVFAYPPPRCKWFINGQVSEDLSTVDSNGNEHTCKLSSNSDLTNIAHGDYDVNISNELGSTSHSITVPDGTDLYPVYLVVVEVLHIVIVIIIIITVIIVIGNDKGTNATTIVSIVTGVLIAVCVIILIYVLAHIKEVFWIIVSCLMVVFSILTALIIPIIYVLLTKKVSEKNVKSVFWCLMVLCGVIILFSLALLIYLSVIFAQYDVCEKDNLLAGVCLQAVDLLFNIGLTVLVYKKLEPSSSRSVILNSKTEATKQKTPQIQNIPTTVGTGKQGVGVGKQRVGVETIQQGQKGKKGKAVKQQGEKGETDHKDGLEGKKVKKKKSGKKEKTRVDENNDIIDSKTKHQYNRPLPHPQTNLSNLPPVRGQILK